MVTGEIQFRVRYSETDRMGFLHHGHFLLYFEEGRVELLRSQGLSYREIEDNGFFLVISKAQIKFHKPAQFDDLLTLRTSVSRTTSVKIEHAYQLFRGEDLLAEGETTLACVDKDGKVQRLPDCLHGS